MEQILPLLPSGESDGAGEEDSRVERLCVELFTKRMMLIPSEMLTGEDLGDAVARRELTALGISIHSDEEVLQLLQSEESPITALVVVPSLLISELMSRARVVNFEVAILRDRIVSENHLHIDLMEGITTIKYFGLKGLLFADIYEAKTTSAAIYWIDTLCSAIRIEPHIPIYISRGNETLRRLLKQKFTNVMICE